MHGCSTFSRPAATGQQTCLPLRMFENVAFDELTSLKPNSYVYNSFTRLAGRLQYPMFLNVDSYTAGMFVIPPANFVCRGYTVFTLSICPSVTLCFLNNSKSHCWIFIKPCKHVHICKTNTLDKKVRARGQFY